MKAQIDQLSKILTAHIMVLETDLKEKQDELDIAEGEMSALLDKTTAINKRIDEINADLRKTAESIASIDMFNIVTN